MTRASQKSSDDGDEDFRSDEYSSDVYDVLESDPAQVPYKGRSKMEKTTLHVTTVALLVFFTVSGGPMGSEDAVRQQRR